MTQKQMIIWTIILLLWFVWVHAIILKSWYEMIERDKQAKLEEVEKYEKATIEDLSDKEKQINQYILSLIKEHKYLDVTVTDEWQISMKSPTGEEVLPLDDIDNLLFCSKSCKVVDLSSEEKDLVKLEDSEMNYITVYKDWVIKEIVGEWMTLFKESAYVDETFPRPEKWYLLVTNGEGIQALEYDLWSKVEKEYILKNLEWTIPTYIYVKNLQLKKEEAK